MENFVRLLRRVSSPFRKIHRAEEQYDEQPRRKLFVVIGDGYPMGAKYVKKTAMDWTRAAAVYGDDVLIAYNNYRKARQNGNIPNSGTVPTAETKQRPVGIQQKIQ